MNGSGGGLFFGEGIHGQGVLFRKQAVQRIFQPVIKLKDTVFLQDRQIADQLHRAVSDLPHVVAVLVIAWVTLLHCVHLLLQLCFQCGVVFLGGVDVPVGAEPACGDDSLRPCQENGGTGRELGKQQYQNKNNAYQMDEKATVPDCKDLVFLPECPGKVQQCLYGRLRFLCLHQPSKMAFLSSFSAS